MSEHEQSDPRDEGAAILDANIERLLSHAQQRPAVPSEARARMLERLQGAARNQAGDPDPKPAESAAPIALDARRRRVGPVTIVVALAAVIVLAWVLGLGSRLIDRDDAAELATWEHHDPGARAITLADGSTALLRTGTEIVELGPRHLKLVAGEILLDVREAAEPLLVETPQGRAVVLGTRLLLRSDAAETLAAVLRGRATLEASGVASTLLLQAGEQAMLRAATAPERIAGRRLSHEIDWARELLSPEAEVGPVRRGNLIARVPRWTGQQGRSAEWPLPVRELTVDVHVEDGHVRTTIDQTFFNHLERDLEGVYQFPLPPKAAIARLAMYVDGTRMEAGVVTRDRGRDIYEQIVHRRRDPALLEWMQGNLFQVRIFPLPARTEKRVLLSYTTALDELYGRGELRVPIPQLDLPVGKVHYRVRVVGGAGRAFESRHQAFEVHEQGEDLIAEFSAGDHVIGDDIIATLSGEPAAIEHHRLAQADGHRLLGVRLRPDLAAELTALSDRSVAAPARDYAILFDSSASRGPAELEAQRRFVLALLDHLDPGDRVAVLRFDARLQWAGAELERVDAVDRAALTRFLERARVGIGATDLGAAIDAGVERLAAAPATETTDGRARVPTLLYLGDGLGQELDPSGTTDPGAYVDTLAARLTGRAAFVGVSFGPSYDEPALERLAAAGDGLHVHVEDGESVSWRALELLTTLATPRVLELEAELVDAQGDAIASERTHADARSLAEGESLELLARLDPGEPDPVAVQLRGRAGEHEWSTRVELPRASEDARWIPRAWARAHVAALTEAGVEAHADEITQLGLEHFLVTPTTSLLVLESEQMYRNFDVHRPPADAWARYEAPETIEVVREGGSAIAGRGQYVVRTPVQMLIDYSNSGWNGLTDVRTRGFGPLVPLGSADDAFGLGGLGLVGTGRGGGGTGFGFGLDNTIGLGATGLIGKGGGGGSEFGARGKRVDGRSRDVADSSRFSGFVSRQLETATWATGNRQQAMKAEPSRDEDSRFASTIVTGASAHAGPARFALAQPWPQARHYSQDRQLDDLGELAPALFEEPFDLAREELLLRGIDGARGSVSDAAAQLIAAARAAQGNVRFALPEGGTLDIDAHSRFAVVGERFGFLDERVIYDGEQLRADYPELGLSVARAVGPTSPALLGEWVPWLVPSAEHLAHFYVVERSGPRTLKLTPIAAAEALAADSADSTDSAGSAWLEVELDAEHRVAALRMHVGRQLISTSEFRWTNDALVLVIDGRERELERRGPAQAIATTSDAAQATTVTLPLPSPTDLALALDAHTPGDAAWIALQHQRLAGYAALADAQAQLDVLDALREHAGRVLPGELTLAGSALHYATVERRKAILDAAGDGPLVDYLDASLRSSARGMVGLANDDELRGTPVGFLASYRALLHEAEHRPGEASLRRLEQFLTDYDHPTHAYVATMQLSNRWWSQLERKSKAWLALAEQGNRYKYVALHQAGYALYQRGRYAEAGDVFARSFREARDDQTLPVIDWTVQWAMTQSVGEAGWQLAWVRLRERVAESGDAELAMGFWRAASQLGRTDEVARVIAGLDPGKLAPGVALTLFDALISTGRTREAADVLAVVGRREDLRDTAAVLWRASLLAEQQGRLDEAADALERAMATVLDSTGMDLDSLRSSFARLFELRARLATPLGAAADGRADASSERALERALTVADRWRLEDPDNPEIDRLCAELLWSLGQADRAWRQLSSALDRHAAEGETLAWVADALERGGDLERADAVWARAIRVEPTDPTHRLRRAQNLLATGHDGPALALLDEVIEGEWQPRFAWAVSQAKQLGKLLEP